MLGTWFHFYAILKPKGKLCLRISISFFNELDIEWELFSHASVSFFNELDTEWELCLKEWFHFYASLKPMGKLCLKNPINMIYIGWNLAPSMISSEAYP